MVIVIILLVLIVNVFGAQKSSVTVLEFKTSGVDNNIGLQITDAFSARLFESNKFNVLERSQLNSILKEQSLQTSGACSDNACMIEIGQLAGVQYIFVGSVGKLGNKLTINAKELNVETGVIMAQKYMVFDGSIEELVLKALPNFVDYFIYPPPKKIVLLNDSISVKIDKNKRINFEVVPINSSLEVGYKIFNPDVIKLINGNVVVPLKVGKTKVAIYSVGDKNVSDTISINVLDTAKVVKKRSGVATFFRVVTGLASVATVGVGIYFNNQVNSTYDKYLQARDENEATSLGDDLENYRNKRNLFYGIAGASGAIFLITLAF